MNKKDRYILMEFGRYRMVIERGNDSYFAIEEYSYDAMGEKRWERVATLLLDSGSVALPQGWTCRAFRRSSLKWRIWIEKIKWVHSI